jgi:hypothetical protein
LLPDDCRFRALSQWAAGGTRERSVIDPWTGIALRRLSRSLALAQNVGRHSERIHRRGQQGKRSRPACWQPPLCGEGEESDGGDRRMRAPRY